MKKYNWCKVNVLDIRMQDLRRLYAEYFYEYEFRRRQAKILSRDMILTIEVSTVKIKKIYIKIGKHNVVGICVSEGDYLFPVLLYLAKI